MSWQSCFRTTGTRSAGSVEGLVEPRHWSCRSDSRCPGRSNLTRLTGPARNRPPSRSRPPRDRSGGPTDRKGADPVAAATAQRAGPRTPVARSATAPRAIRDALLVAAPIRISPPSFDSPPVAVARETLPDRMGSGRSRARAAQGKATRSCWSWTLSLSRKVDARTALGAIMVIVALPSRLGYRSGPRGECLRRARPRPPHSRCRMCRPEPTPPRFR
jgi:hypothetical protein